MTRQQPITQEMIELYDDYTHVGLDRRAFLERLARLAGGMAVAAALLPLLEANKAAAAVVPRDDRRLRTNSVSYPGGAGTMNGYLAAPAEAAGKLPAVMIIHENRGLNPHIEDVVRRAALEGFLALGPDFLSPAGGTPSDEDKARQMIRALDDGTTINNAAATVAFLKSHPMSSGRVGAIGFCWGGGMVNQTAVRTPNLSAAVAFYGRVPDINDVPKIRARMLLHYAGLDARINQGIPGYRKALEDAKVEHAVHVYEGVNHAFHNDTAGARYNEAAAKLAWSRTVAFLKATLNS